MKNFLSLMRKQGGNRKTSKSEQFKTKLLAIVRHPKSYQGPQPNFHC